MCVKHCCLSLPQERWLSKPCSRKCLQATQKQNLLILDFCYICQVNTVPWLEKLCCSTNTVIYGQNYYYCWQMLHKWCSFRRFISRKHAWRRIVINTQCYKDLTSKHIVREQRPGMKRGKEPVLLQPSLNKWRQKDHLPLLYFNPFYHLPEITHSTTTISASLAMKTQELNFIVFQQRTCCTAQENWSGDEWWIQHLLLVRRRLMDTAYDQEHMLYPSVVSWPRADAVSITHLLTKSWCCIHHSSPDQEQTLYPSLVSWPRADAVYSICSWSGDESWI